MTSSRPGRALRLLFRLPVAVYRCGCGRLLGHRFLLLIHTGRRSKLRRYTVLEVIAYRSQEPEAIVMSGFGAMANWLRNIEAMPNPEVVIGSRRFVAGHRRVGEDDAVEVLLQYQRQNRLAAPIIRLVLSRLLGWRFDGSRAHCRRAVAQLPLIAFSPKH
jgi:deazaflavin-dependent oxidoreductase (nitroreductase family)